MSAFEFVTVFFSVVLGMAVAQLMTAIAELIENRHRVRSYWVQVVWVVTILVLQAQAWWGLWQLQAVSEWNIVGFMLIVIPPITAPSPYSSSWRLASSSRWTELPSAELDLIRTGSGMRV